MKINSLFLSFLLAVLCFTSCQDEITQIENPNEHETIVSNSTLVNLMSRVTANFGAADDILDGASCFSVELPVTIVVNGVSIVIETEADLEQLEDLLNDVSVNGDILDFAFPITIIFNDYSQIVIENEDELQNFADECTVGENDIIDCADFVYPISFSVFNSGFNLVNTIVIETDEALYAFIYGLDADENALIVSLNFPVTIAYANGETIEVNTNTELVEAIEVGEQFCEDDSDDCLEDTVMQNLIECPWDFSDGTGNFNNYQLVFNANGELLILEGDATSAIGGNWSLSATDNGILLNFSELTVFQDSLEGDWLIIECDDSRIVIVRSDTAIVLEHDCDAPYDNELFNCFSDFELLACANDAGEAEFNLSADTIGLVNCTESFTASFHYSLTEAESNANAISNTASYFSIEGEVYLRINAASGNFEVFTVYLNTENCNYYECFESFDAILEVCDNGTDSLYQFNLPMAFANCTPSADVVTYHETEPDAYNNVNPIVDPSTYNTPDVESTIYVRVEIQNQLEVFPIQLNIIDCNVGNCTEGDIDGTLTECQWNITSYNGSDNLISYNFNFEQNSGIVVIYNDTITIDAGWSTSQTDTGVVIEFSNVSGPNIQAVNGSWLVVECTANQLVLHNVNDSNNEIVLDRTCE